jgi:hypothetical protein
LLPYLQARGPSNIDPCLSPPSWKLKREIVWKRGTGNRAFFCEPPAPRRIMKRRPSAAMMAGVTDRLWEFEELLVRARAMRRVLISGAYVILGTLALFGCFLFIRGCYLIGTASGEFGWHYVAMGLALISITPNWYLVRNSLKRHAKLRDQPSHSK